jgi:uncharacterized protein (DUF58 family)
VSTLLEPEFIRELEVLRRRLSVEARSRGSGSRRGRSRGGSAEFAEHRPYAPGDDLARLDWLAFARTREPLSKVFHVEEDVVVRLCVDASASLGFDAVKMDRARRIAAAIGYLALASSERAQVLVLGGRDDARRVYPTHRGRAGTATLLRELAGVDPHGALGLSETLEQLAMRARPPGALVVVSDFLDPSPLVRAHGRAGGAGDDVNQVQVR